MRHRTRAATTRQAGDPEGAAIHAAQLARQAALEAALARVGCTFRDDSFLCKRFIARGPDAEAGHWSQSMAHVVERMAQLRFLYNHTNYEDTLWDIREEIKFEVGWWHKLATEEQAQATVLARFGGCFPDRWPWIAEARWTPARHAAYPMHIRERVKTLLLCLYVATPLGGLDPATRGTLFESIAGMAVQPPPPSNLSRRRHKKIIRQIRAAARG